MAGDWHVHVCQVARRVVEGCCTVRVSKQYDISLVKWKQQVLWSIASMGKLAESVGNGTTGGNGLELTKAS